MIAMSLQEVARKARYGHKDWIAYTKDGVTYAAPKTRDSVKAAMLANGTQRRMTLVCANDGVFMRVSWRLAVTLFNNSRYMESC